MSCLQNSLRELISYHDIVSYADSIMMSDNNDKNCSSYGLGRWKSREESSGGGEKKKKEIKFSHREENEKLQYILSQQIGLNYSLWAE